VHHASFLMIKCEGSDLILVVEIDVKPIFLSEKNKTKKKPLT